MTRNCIDEVSFRLQHSQVLPCGMTLTGVTVPTCAPFPMLIILASLTAYCTSINLFNLNNEGFMRAFAATPLPPEVADTYWRYYQPPRSARFPAFLCPLVCGGLRIRWMPFLAIHLFFTPCRAALRKSLLPRLFTSSVAR